MPTSCWSSPWLCSGPESDTAEATRRDRRVDRDGDTELATSTETSADWPKGPKMKTEYAVACAAVLLARCSSSTNTTAVVITPSNTTGFVGRLLDQPAPSPDVTLTNTNGKPFDIAEDTDLRRVHRIHPLPDVCPTTMADLSVAIGFAARCGQADRCTVSPSPPIPERDTSKATGKWLNSFSWDGITGLTRTSRTSRPPHRHRRIFIDPVTTLTARSRGQHGRR